jgi:hypothetical protein
MKSTVKCRSHSTAVKTQCFDKNRRHVVSDEIRRTAVEFNARSVVRSEAPRRNETRETGTVTPRIGPILETTVVHLFTKLRAYYRAQHLYQSSQEPATGPYPAQEMKLNKLFFSGILYTQTAVPTNSFFCFADYSLTYLSLTVLHNYTTFLLQT